MPKRPKLPKSQQASIPRADKFEGGTIKSDLRDLILPPLDFETRSSMPLVNRQLEAYAAGMDDAVGRDMIFATGDADPFADLGDRRFFAIDTKHGGHVGFMMEDGFKTAAEKGMSAHSALEQVMEAAAVYWGPGVELEVYAMEDNAGYGVRPRHNVIQGSQDPENEKIKTLLTEQRAAYMREHRRYPTLRELYYELVRLDKWMNNEKSYAYMAEWCAKLGFTGSKPQGKTIHQVISDMEMHPGSVTGRMESRSGPSRRYAGGLYPYQQEMMERVMSDTPFFVDIDSDYAGFKDRYVKRGDWSRPYQYSGKMSDYLNQHAYVLRLGDYTPNHIDDVYNRGQRRAQMKAEAKLREYCASDVLIFADYAGIERRILFTMLDGYPTTEVSHRLTGPYGWESGQGTGILIEYMSGSDDHPWPTRREADMISGIFVSYGCAPVYAQKAADSLFGCGQYSCIVTVSKLALRNLGFAMEAVGCVMAITQHPGEYPQDTNRDTR